MGSGRSDLTDNIKAQAREIYTSQAGTDETSIYHYVGISGAGELVRLMRRAVMTKNYDEVDHVIRHQIVRYLHNNGNGQYISVRNIVDGKKSTANFKRLVKHATKAELSNEIKICFDINKRGAVGETLLHLCLLNGTQVHNHLARRLIYHWPEMVNDIYMSEEFYGQSPLHIAIINQDIYMVKILIKNGANVYHRSLGNFFRPNDQKSPVTRLSRFLRSYFMMATSNIEELNTEYGGDHYYGEYPLSYAACLNLTACVRFLMAEGTDPNRQDSNGNNVLHMLVIYDNLEMLKLMIHFGADHKVKNNEGLTPFTLAAKLARKEIFKYLMKLRHQRLLVYADIECGAIGLKDLDSIDADGLINEKSAFFLCVYGETDEHLEMIEIFFTELLDKKWNNYIKRRFYIELAFFAVYFILSLVYTCMKADYYRYMKNLIYENVLFTSSQICGDNFTIYSNSTKQIHEHCTCIYLNPDDPNKDVRLAIEVLLLVYTVAFLVFKLDELRIQKPRLYFILLLGDMPKLCFIVSLICVILILPIRLACYTDAEDYLTLCAILFMSANFLYFARGFRIIASFVSIFMSIIKRDLSKFFLIYSVFLVGFSQAFYLSFLYYEDPEVDQTKQRSGNMHLPIIPQNHLFRTPVESLYTVIVISVGESYIVYEQLVKSDTHRTLSMILFTIYLIIVSILIVNIMIAMMASTYLKRNMHKHEWIRQWGQIILAIEQNVSVSARIREQRNYTNLMISSDRDFIVKGKLTDLERSKMRAITKRMQQEQIYLPK